jgi:hypothetical protein
MQLCVHIRTRDIGLASNSSEHQESDSQVGNAIVPDI